MNHLISGQIGSGKTYYAVKNFIIPSLKQGRFVYTNIDLGHTYIYDVWSKFSHYIGRDISKFINVITDTPAFLENLRLISYDENGSRLPRGSVVIIDEAHQVFNYLQTNYINKQVYEFLAYSRHFNIDLVFITQSPELLSKFVINLCNNFISVYNLKQNSSLFKNTCRVEIRPTFTGWVTEKRILKFDKEIFSLYRSFVGDTDESVFKRSIFPSGFGKPLLGLVLVIVAFFFVLVKGVGYLKI